MKRRISFLLFLVVMMSFSVLADNCLKGSLDSTSAKLCEGDSKSVLCSSSNLNTIKLGYKCMKLGSVSSGYYYNWVPYSSESCQYNSDGVYGKDNSNGWLLCNNKVGVRCEKSNIGFVKDYYDGPKRFDALCAPVYGTSTGTVEVGTRWVECNVDSSQEGFANMLLVKGGFYEATKWGNKNYYCAPYTSGSTSYESWYICPSSLKIQGSNGVSSVSTVQNYFCGASGWIHKEAVCNNNVDDDGDGKIDCMDTDCVNDKACVFTDSNFPLTFTTSSAAKSFDFVFKSKKYNFMWNYGPDTQGGVGFKILRIDGQNVMDDFLKLNQEKSFTVDGNVLYIKNYKWYPKLTSKDVAGSGISFALTSNYCVPSCPVPVDVCEGKKDTSSNGCGGTCNVVGVKKEGACVLPSPCTPLCSDKQCGSNGCAGSCGTCSTGETCDANGKCLQPEIISLNDDLFAVCSNDADCGKDAIKAKAKELVDKKSTPSKKVNAGAIQCKAFDNIDNKVCFVNLQPGGFTPILMQEPLLQNEGNYDGKGKVGQKDVQKIKDDPSLLWTYTGKDLKKLNAYLQKMVKNWGK